MEFVERVSIYVKRAMKYVHLLPKILEVYQKDAEYIQSTLPTGEPPKDIRLSPKNTDNRRKSSITVVNPIKDSSNNNNATLNKRNDLENIQPNDNSKPLFPESTPIKPPIHPSMNNSNSYPTINTSNNNNSNNNNKKSKPDITVQTNNLNGNPSVKSLFASKYMNATKSDDILLSRPITPQCSDSSINNLHSMSSFRRREVSSMSPLPYSPQIKVKKILETPSNSQKKLALYNNRGSSGGLFTPINPSTRKKAITFDYSEEDDVDIQRMKSPLLSPDSEPSPNDDFVVEDSYTTPYVSRVKPIDFTKKKEEIRRKQLQQQNQQNQQNPPQQNQINVTTQQRNRPPPIKTEETKETKPLPNKTENNNNIYATCTPKQIHEMENLLLADQYYWMANYFYLLSETMIDGDEDVLKYFQFHLPELQWQWKFMDYIPSRLKNNNEFTSLIYNSLKKV